MQKEEGLDELLSYIKQLEEQNIYLRKLLEESDWQILRFQILHQSLLSRIFQMKKLVENKKTPFTKKEKLFDSVLSMESKTKEEMVMEQIFEDEEFKREISEAVEFAKLWKEKKTAAV